MDAAGISFIIALPKAFVTSTQKPGFFTKVCCGHPGCIQKPGFSQAMTDNADVMPHNLSVSRHIGTVSGHNPFVMPHNPFASPDNAIAIGHNPFAMPDIASAMPDIGLVSPDRAFSNRCVNEETHTA